MGARPLSRGAAALADDRPHVRSPATTAGSGMPGAAAAGPVTAAARPGAARIYWMVGSELLLRGPGAARQPRRIENTRITGTSRESRSTTMARSGPANAAGKGVPTATSPGAAVGIEDVDHVPLAPRDLPRHPEPPLRVERNGA